MHKKEQRLITAAFPVCICDSTQACSVPRGPVTTVCVPAELSPPLLSQLLFLPCSYVSCSWRAGDRGREWCWDGESIPRGHGRTLACTRMYCVHMHGYTKRNRKRCSAAFQIVTQHRQKQSKITTSRCSVTPVCLWWIMEIDTITVIHLPVVTTHFQFYILWSDNGWLFRPGAADTAKKTAILFVIILIFYTCNFLAWF